MAERFNLIVGAVYLQILKYCAVGEVLVG